MNCCFSPQDTLNLMVLDVDHCPGGKDVGVEAGQGVMVMGDTV